MFGRLASSSTLSHSIEGAHDLANNSCPLPRVRAPSRQVLPDPVPDFYVSRHALQHGRLDSASDRRSPHSVHQPQGFPSPSIVCFSSPAGHAYGSDGIVCPSPPSWQSTQAALPVFLSHSLESGHRGLGQISPYLLLVTPFSRTMAERSLAAPGSPYLPPRTSGGTLHRRFVQGMGRPLRRSRSLGDLVFDSSSLAHQQAGDASSLGGDSLPRQIPNRNVGSPLHGQHNSSLLFKQRGGGQDLRVCLAWRRTFFCDAGI